MNLKGKTAIVTGGGQGIGRAIARRFLEEGMRVILAEIDLEAGGEAQNELSALGEVLFIPTDVAREEDVVRLAGRARKIFGHLDALINNAAISDNKPMEELRVEEWDRVISVNLTGPFLCAKYCAPLLRHSRGSIVNIASTRALQSERNTEAYSSAKGGLVALTHALAVSLGPEVRVNCVSPGWIETGDWRKRAKKRPVQHTVQDRLQHPAGRVGIPADVASLVTWLIGPEAGFVTGANIVIDGGMTRKMIYAE